MQAVPQRNIPESNAKNESDKEDILYRKPPHNIEAEQAVLGAVLTNNQAMNRIGDFLMAEHFYEPVHQRIYEAILRFNDRGLIATPVTLKNHFDTDEALDDFGGASYLARMAGMASGIVNVKDHASIVYSLSISRNLIDIGEDMVNDAYDSNGELRASEQIEKSEQKLFNLSSEGNSDTSFVALNKSVGNAIELADSASKKKGGISGVPTGFSDMDDLLGGLHNSDLVILAARPSMGKTALAVNLAMNAAEKLIIEYNEKKKSTDDIDNLPKEAGSIGVFSLEMSSEQLATRMLSMETGINAGNIRRGKLTREDSLALIKASTTLHELPVFIDDTPALSISAIRTRARRLKRKHNLALLVVDYLQLIRGSSAMSQSNRVQEISEITMGLKAIAKELDIPVLALSQLSRAVEQREDKRPQLSDLRESGSIEQDADVVMFIYREEYYLERSRPPEPKDPSNEEASDTKALSSWYEKNGGKYEAARNKTEIIVSKHRNGPIGNVALFFDNKTTKFKNFANEYFA